MSEYRAKAELEPGASDLERRGRIAGITLFWLLFCYVIGMSSRSILSALFWPEAAPLAAAPGMRRCASELQLLEQQLRERTSDAVGSGRLDKFRHWLRGWDRRVLALSGGCGPLERTRAGLLELRSEIGSLVDRYERGPLQLQRRIQRELESTGRATPRRPDEGP